MRRICFVCLRAYGYFDPDAGFTGGGAERQIHLLSTSLADRFDVHVVVGDYGQPRTVEREGVTLHRAYPLQPRQHALQPAEHLAILGRAMRRADADVYVYRGGPRKAPFVWSLARLLRRKWVYNVANDANLGQRPATLPNSLGWLYSRALRNADGVIAQTPLQQRLLREGYGVDAVVVPNGYPRVEEPPDTDGAYFLWVGSLDAEQKRPHLYLDCAEALPDQQFRLAGGLDPDDEYHQHIERRAARLDNVTLLGRVDPDAIHEQYRDAIALVSTSAYEGFPNVFLEAWRQGTPVVSLAVDPGRYGIPDDVCATGDPDRLQAILDGLATDADYRRRLSTNARELFESTYEQSSVATQYGDAIRRILDGQP